MRRGSVLPGSDESVDLSENIRLMTLRHITGQQQRALGSQEEHQTEGNANSQEQKEDVCSVYQC